jgi:hypothetical protein
MTTEFDESIKEGGAEYKYITSCLRVYTDGGFARYNLEEDEWQDEVGDKKGLISYYNLDKKIASKESKSKLVARAFLPNPAGKKTVRHKDLNIKNCAVDNLEWDLNFQPKTRGVGYVINGTKYVVRMFDKNTKKTKYYGSYYTQAEAEARVAEIRSNS